MKEWPCEHILKKDGERFWRVRSGGVGEPSISADSGPRWDYCPFCGASRPKEPKVRRLAPALVKNSSNLWTVTKALYESAEQAQQHLNGPLLSHPPKEVRWPYGELVEVVE